MSKMFSGSVTFLRQGVCYFLSIFLLPNVVTVMKQESELKLIMVLTNGHLDHIFDVLDAHRHPCIMLGRFALLWMGVAVLQEHCLELVVRNSQFAAISMDIQATGNWTEIPLVRQYGEDFLQPPPRVFERTNSAGFTVKIWCEDAVFLSVDPPADWDIQTRPFLIEAPCCETLNPVLLELCMHPGPEISPYKPHLLTTPDIRFLPHIRCQTESRQPKSKVYIPTISRYMDALIAQRQWLEENDPDASCIKGPATDASNLIRYMFLEMPSQREKILPFLNAKSWSRTEKVLDRYKRTYKNKFRVKPLRGGTGEGVFNGTAES